MSTSRAKKILQRLASISSMLFALTVIAATSAVLSMHMLALFFGGAISGFSFAGIFLLLAAVFVAIAWRLKPSLRFLASAALLAVCIALAPQDTCSDHLLDADCGTTGSSP